MDDQKAVDVLLDHGATGSKLTKPATMVPPHRLMAVSKVLELLNTMPAADPPKDLVARTMARIDQDIPAQVGDREINSQRAAQPPIH